MGQSIPITVGALRSHLYILLRTAWPNIITSLVSLIIPVSSTVYLGHISSELIGGAALGNMFGNATGFAVGSGLAMALDTLCSQAFGAKKYKLVGLHCQRAMCILTIACFPIALLWFNSYLILQFIGNKETAKLSQHWLRILMFGMWPRMMYEALRRYLIGQRILWPITLTVVIVTPLHLLNAYLLIFRFGFGFEGAAYSVVLSYWLLLASLLTINYIRVTYLRKKEKQKKMNKKPKLVELLSGDFSLSGGEDEGEGEGESSGSMRIAQEEEEEEEAVYDEENGDPLHTWPTVSFDIFRGWLAYMKLGVATTLSLVIEWGSFEVNAAIATHLGTVPLASHAILANSASIWYATPVGIAGATTALVGNMLGAQEPERARLFTMVAYAVNLVFCVTNGAVGMLYKQYLGSWFTSDPEVIKLIDSMVVVLWLYGIFDGLKAVGMAVLRGSGRPAITVYGNVLSCLIVGYPVAFGLVFGAKLGLHGLWLGMSSAWLVASTIYGIVIARTNWQLEVEKADRRNHEALLTTRRHAHKLVLDGASPADSNSDVSDDGEGGKEVRTYKLEDSAIVVNGNSSSSSSSSVSGNDEEDPDGAPLLANK